MLQRLFSKLALACIFLLAGAAVTVAILILWPLPQPTAVGRDGPFIIRNVSVVDVDNGVLLAGRNVVVADGRIRSVEPAASRPAAAGMTEIDGAGRYLMPGLWDMHTHSNPFSTHYQHPLFIANGVTGVRDMWGCLSEPDPFFACIDDRKAWNRALAAGTGISPRYVGQSSFQINGGNEVPAGFPDFFRADDGDAAAALVDHYATAGADFLKIYTELSPRAYAAIAAAADARGLTLAGHRPIAVALEDVLEAGQRSIEHGRVFLFECHAGAAEFRALPDPLAAYTTARRARLVAEQDPERCRNLMRAMADSDTWWTPTLLTLRMGALAHDPEFRNDSRLRFVPYVFRRWMWTGDANAKARTRLDAAGRNVYAALYDQALQHVGDAHREGVRLLTGTDAFDTYVFPGFGVHDELEQLVAAGLTPAEALKTATVNAALFSGAEASHGSIAAGKAADMVLLTGNPLGDIANTRRIDGVFVNGRYFDRPALDSLLRHAEEAAGSVRFNVQIAWAALRSPPLRVQFAD